MALALLAGLTPTARAQGGGLNEINHVIVIYQENWSFDSLYGKFPGANGIANAGAAVQQVDKNGQPYAALPQPKDNNEKPPAADPRFPARPAGRALRRGEVRARRPTRPATWCTATTRSSTRSTAARWTSSSPGATPPAWS